MKEDKNVIEAKQSLKAQINFFENLIKHLNGKDENLKGRAMWASWCLHRYMHDGLITDIKKAMKEYGTNDKPN